VFCAVFSINKLSILQNIAATVYKPERLDEVSKQCVYIVTRYFYKLTSTAWISDDISFWRIATHAAVIFDFSRSPMAHSRPYMYFTHHNAVLCLKHSRFGRSKRLLSWRKKFVFCERFYFVCVFSCFLFTQPLGVQLRRIYVYSIYSYWSCCCHILKFTPTYLTFDLSSFPIMQQFHILCRNTGWAGRKHHIRMNNGTTHSFNAIIYYFWFDQWTEQIRFEVLGKRERGLTESRWWHSPFRLYVQKPRL